MSKSRKWFFFGAVFVVLASAGCVGPSDGSPSPAPPLPSDGLDEVAPETVERGQGRGGGSVENQVPVVQSFGVDRAEGDGGAGFAVVFSGVVMDPNSENQLSSLSLAASGPAPISAARTLTGPERERTEEPADFESDGWKIWSGSAPNDGLLNYAYRHNFAPGSAAGAYAWVLTVSDAPGLQAASAPVEVRVIAPEVALIEVASLPVRLDGSPSDSPGFGDWDAQPGQTNVPALNYLKITNAGTKASVGVLIDFNEAVFAGVSEPAFSIPLDSNLEFGWFEDATPGATSPGEGAFQYLPASPQGSLLVTFSAPGNVIYVHYRIVALPAVLASQDYAASFTVTET